MPININHVGFSYNKGTPFEKQALRDVNLHIDDREFVGLIGHTGSGKSTLIQLLNALLKPDEGSVEINGLNIHADKSKLKETRSKVGLVFQYPEHQLFETSVAKDIAFGPENLGLGAAEVKERVEWALELVGLDMSVAEKSPFELSGGQKRRAAIAGVLAMKPEILVLDEPAAGLDPRGRDEILGSIKELKERLGITVILVSHSMEDVARLVERIVVISQGSVVMDGLPAVVFSEPTELEKIGLTAPQAARLAEALKKRGLTIPEGVYTVEAAVAAIAALLEKNR